MASLFSHLRVHQIFGANTDVGKTVLTTALVRASAVLGRSTAYLKPASTGPLADADDEYVQRYTRAHRDKIKTHCLFRYKEPVSPHLAALMEQTDSTEPPDIPSDDTFIGSIANHIREVAGKSSNKVDMYVETAGGVHSPTLSGATQADVYRPLFLPTILIGDSRLGGISATISAYESLILRGYHIDLVLLFQDEYYRNWEYLDSYFSERGVKVEAVPTPPKKNIDYSANFLSTDQYYQEIVPASQKGRIFGAIEHLDICHARRLQELHSMPRRTLDTVWWPFVQHGLYTKEQDVTVIDSASGDVFSVYNGHHSAEKSPLQSSSLLEPLFDGSASWWTQTLGHAHPSLTLAAARAAGRYGHVMFPQGIHLPALKLAERLVKSGPGKGWASRAFFSDNGSTGMEVALKMALRAFAVREHGGPGVERRRDLGVLGLKGSYHGDTIGAMDACEKGDGVYTCEWHEGRGFWLDPPSISIRQGKLLVSLPPAIAIAAGKTAFSMDTMEQAYDVEARLQTELAGIYKDYVSETLKSISRSQTQKLAALVLEPIVMGAGGMIFVDPLFQRVLIDAVRSPGAAPGEWSGLPVIFDEVFIGLYRLGFDAASTVLGVHPDISVHAKILTGGLVPLSVTMASESIFNAFYSDNKADALLHGHSYTAYPVGCEVANETLTVLEKLSASDEWNEARSRWGKTGSGEMAPSASPRVWSFWDPKFVEALSHTKLVGEVMAMGTVLAFKVTDGAEGYESHSAQKALQSIRQSVSDSNGSSPVPGGAPYGINYRTLGNIAYFMLSLNTPSAIVRSVEDRIWAALNTSTTEES